MKKVISTLCMAFIATVSFSQVNRFEMTDLMVKNGMGVDVPVSVMIVHDDNATFTVEDAIIARNENLKNEGRGFDDLDACFASMIDVQSIFTKTFVVKNKATWVPTEVFMYWKEDVGMYVGSFKGYASNLYGVQGEIQDFIQLDANGNMARR